LVRKTTALSGNTPEVRDSSLTLLEELFVGDATPPEIAGKLLSHIRRKTGVWDPYATLKYREYRDALAAIGGLHGGDRLEDLLSLSALGNSTDYFTGGTFMNEVPVMQGNVDLALAAISRESDEVLMLGDNMGDFVFDLPLMRSLERQGRKVFYAVRERPAQNDLSMEDVLRFGLHDLHPRIISTGKANVGLPREDVEGEIERLWKGEATVIAKGMGNFETISEFDGERQVVYIMKVKCPAVARAVGSDIGTYIAHVR
jgi:uncharacterized protein with ATP-grasp and redox domains